MGDNDPSCQGWMMTFGDCMSLLLTFFVMLISFTSFDNAKLGDFIGVMQGAFDVRQPLREEDAGFRLDENAEAKPQLLSREEVAMISPLVPAVKTLVSDLLDERFGDQIYFRFSDDGMTIILEASAVYLQESNALLSGNEQLIRALGNVIFAISNEVRVTAVVPEDVVFNRSVASSPWSFSAKRAQSLVQALVNVNNLPRNRFGVAAHVALASDSLVWKQTALKEYIEVQVVEKRQIQDAQPEDIVIHDRWQ